MRLFLISLFLASGVFVNTIAFNLKCYNGEDSVITCDDRNSYLSSPVCVHLVQTPDENGVRNDMYGCFPSEALPTKCGTGFQNYLTSATIHNDSTTSYKGSLFCCTYDLCNSLFTALGIRVYDQVHSVSLEWVWPSTVIYFLIVASVIPFMNELLKERRAASLRRAEKAHCLREKQSALQERQISNKVGLSPRFLDLRTMNETIKRIDKGNIATIRDDSRKNINKTVKISPEVSVFRKDFEHPAPVIRNFPSQYHSLVARLVEHGPFRFDFDPCELGDLFDNVADILRSESSLIDLPGDVYIYGNLDGNYGDLFRWFLLNGWPPRQKVVFLGGITEESSEYSLEVLALIFALKQKLPEHVYILRGSTEVYNINIQGRFTRRVSKCVEHIIQRACGYLPFGALIEERILCVHGGLPLSIKHLDNIRDISRPIYDLEKNTPASDIVFSQAASIDLPIPGARGWYFNGSDQEYNQRLEDMGIALVIRTRNSFKTGYQIFGEKTLSIYSSTNSHNLSSASCAHVTKTLEVRLKKMI